MGQVAQLTKKDRCLSDDEMRAIQHLVWISKALGQENIMVRYFAAMLVQEVQQGPPAAKTIGRQSGLTEDGFVDGAAI